MFSVLRVLPPVILLLCGEVFASTLTVGQSSARPGETAVTVPLTLMVSSGDTVAALQADVEFEPDALSLSRISAGPSATAANKNVSFSVQYPGSVRLIIAGLNQTAILDGVVADMVFDVNQSTIAGVQAILLDEVLAADPTGVSVSVNAVSGGITVTIAGEGEIVYEGEGETPIPHPADLDEDFRMVMSEAIAYLAGWQGGLNLMAYAIRAVYLWQKGEQYGYDATQEPPMCWTTGPEFAATLFPCDVPLKMVWNQVVYPRWAVTPGGTAVFNGKTHKMQS